MDNICHTLVGATLGEAGLRRRTRYASATLMIASNLPDLDVLVFATDIPSQEFRRGWTHGTPAQLLLPIALAGAVTLIGRARPAAPGSPPLDVKWLLALSYVGVFLHVFMDFLNNYGIRLLMPLVERWFYGDTLFIIDPWLWATFAAGIWLARRQQLARPAQLALITAALYIGVMFGSARAARAIVRDAWTAANGTPPVALMVGPQPVTPFTRAVIIDAGDHYVTGTFRWASSAVELDPQTVPKNDTHPAVAAARQVREIRGFLVWSRFPFWTIEPTDGGTRVSVGDMRFAGGGLLQRNQFLRSTVVPGNAAP